MLTALALAALAISPGSARTAGDENRPPAEEGAQSDDTPKIDTSERSARLLAERVELQSARPRILAPVMLLSGGLVAAVGGLAFVYAGLFTAIYYAFSFAVGSVVLLTIGLVLFAAGIPLTVIGAVKLHRARNERRRVDQRLEQLDREEEAGMQTLATF